MKKLLLFVMVLSLVTVSFAQDWVTIKKTASTFAAYDANTLFFIDTETGWIAGKDGLVQKTMDGGDTWNTVREAVEGSEDWVDIKFADASNGFACAGKGEIYKTTDGGQNWTLVSDASYTENLVNIALINSEILFFAGKNGTLLKTADGCETFTKSDADFFGEDLDAGIAFTNENIGVVASDTDGGFTWYTHDGGSTWTYNNISGFYPLSIIYKRPIAIDCVGDSTFIITGWHKVNLVSTDAGVTYSIIGDYTNELIRNTHINIVDEKNIFITDAYGNLFKSDNGGQDFDTLSIGTGQAIEDICFIDENTGYIATISNHWLKTIDGGKSFKNLLKWPTLNFRGLATPTENKIVVTAFGGGEISISNDGGKSFSYPSNLSTKSNETILECVFIDENNGLIGGGDAYLAKTSDGGDTWALIQTEMIDVANGKFEAIRYLDKNIVFAAGKGGIVFKSIDGGNNWTQLTNEGTADILAIYIFNENNVMLYGEKGEICSIADGETGFSVKRTLPEAVAINAVDFYGTTGLYACDNGYIYRIDENTDTARVVFTDINETDFNDIIFINNSEVYIAGQNGTIYKSNDAGLNWEQQSSPISDNIYELSYNNDLWAIAQNGFIIKLPLSSSQNPYADILINEFLASNDSAVTDENGDYDDFIELYNNGQEAVDVGGLYITDDLSDPAAYLIPATDSELTTIQPGGFLVLWADKETEQGVLHVKIKLSGDGEQIGLVQISGNDTTFIDSLTFGEQTTDISFGRYEDGSDNWMTMTPTPGTSNYNGISSIENISNGIPTEFALHQNYPNPFNPTTTIAFELPEVSDVKLTIFNMLGQKVHEMAQTKLRAGHYNYNFDAGDLSSGIYFYSINAGDYTQFKKMTLIK